MAEAATLDRDPEVRKLAESARKSLRAVMDNLRKIRRKTGVGEMESLGRFLDEVGLLQAAGVSVDPRAAEAVDRGMAVRQKLVEAEGGSLSAGEAAAELGMSKVAILKRYNNGRLLAWQEEKQNAVRFPVWQFKNGRVIPGMEEVLEKLNSSARLDDFGRLLFFLSTSRMLGGKRPLDLLRAGELHKVMRAADAYAP